MYHLSPPFRKSTSAGSVRWNGSRNVVGGGGCLVSTVRLSGGGRRVGIHHRVATPSLRVLSRYPSTPPRPHHSVSPLDSAPRLSSTFTARLFRELTGTSAGSGGGNGGAYPPRALDVGPLPTACRLPFIRCHCQRWRLLPLGASCRAVSSLIHRRRPLRMHRAGREEPGEAPAGRSTEEPGPAAEPSPMEWQVLSSGGKGAGTHHDGGRGQWPRSRHAHFDVTATVGTRSPAQDVNRTGVRPQSEYN